MMGHFVTCRLTGMTARAWQTEHAIAVNTPLGPTTADPGDWIVRDPSGLSVWSPEEFDEAFETGGEDGETVA